MSERTFGVEIEVVEMSEMRAVATLQRAGIRCEEVAYGEAEYDEDGVWIATEDGSLESSSGRCSCDPDDGCDCDYYDEVDCCEVVSPILRGEEGIRTAALVVDLLRNAGAEVNRSCGLHVHVNAEGLSVAELEMIARRYHKWQRQIDRKVKTHRAGNMYCRPLGELVPMLTEHALDSTYSHIRRRHEWSSAFVSRLREGIEANKTLKPDQAPKVGFIKSMGELESVWGHNRYLQINFQAYAKHGTIEFRHYHGTLDPVELRRWITFVLNFVNQSVYLVANPDAEDSLCESEEVI